MLNLSISQAYKKALGRTLALLVMLTWSKTHGKSYSADAGVRKAFRPEADHTSCFSRITSAITRASCSAP
jgi:hypothetical protein